jgi:heat shock protein HslJ/LysM repeat protein
MVFIILVVALLVTAGAALALAQAEVTCKSDYTVQAGDSLSKIAADAYGNSKLYPAIVAATNLKAAGDEGYTAIKSNNVIVPGQKLCLPPAAQAETMAGSAPAPAADGNLTLAQLQNATYTGIYTYPVTLTDGKYEGEPFVEGGAARPTVILVDDLIAYGDLNGDSINDAAVLLAENSGGSGVFTYVGAQLNQNGQPVDAGTVWVGDRTQIKSMTVQNGQIGLEIVTQGPNDPMCCPTTKMRQTYALQKGQLAQVGSEDLGTVSLADLDGTGWSLKELDFDQPVAPDTTITADFTADAVAGSAGCNTYNAAISSDSGQNLTVGPAITTRMACPEPAMTQETQYLTALQKTVQWSYFIGQLALTYQKDDSNIGTLVYAPPTPPAPAAATQITITQVITFVFTTIPTQSQPGACFASAIGLGREDAYRCIVDNQIYDPCFVVDDQPTVVCGADPSTGETGFVLELTEPLPAPEVGSLSQPWLVELADGQVCGLMTGTVPGVGERTAGYGCPDGIYLFDDFQTGQVWLAEKAVIDLTDEGFVVTESEMVPLAIVWR